MGRATRRRAATAVAAVGAATATGEGAGTAPGQPGAPEEYTGEPIDVEGYLDLRDEGYGFLRINGYLPSRDDVYVSVKQARQFGLRKGDHLKGASRPALRNEKNPALLRIDLVNGSDPDKARDRPSFEDLTPLFPDTRLTLENPVRPHEHDGPDHRPDLPDREGPAGPDRRRRPRPARPRS